uniref:Uncharacterized protein n=1 Tax=Zea mays TaxID=4577 RepID=C4J3E4_MAIZE|nr:unknown [Zea mays]
MKLSMTPPRMAVSNPRELERVVLLPHHHEHRHLELGVQPVRELVHRSAQSNFPMEAKKAINEHQRDLPFGRRKEWLPVRHLERVPEAGLLVELGVGVQVLLGEPLREGRGQVGQVHDLLPFLGNRDLGAGEEHVDGAHHAPHVEPAEVGLRPARLLNKKRKQKENTSSRRRRILE